jgi:hypothetical protein
MTTLGWLLPFVVTPLIWKLGGLADRGRGSGHSAIHWPAASAACWVLAFFFLGWGPREGLVLQLGLLAGILVFGTLWGALWTSRRRREARGGP